MRYESVVYACRVFWVLLALAGVGALAYFVPIVLGLAVGVLLLTATLVIAIDG